MNLAKGIVSLATAPARAGLAAADASLNVAATAVGVAKRALGDAGGESGTNAMAAMFGIDDAITRANRLARLLDDDVRVPDPVKERARAHVDALVIDRSARSRASTARSGFRSEVEYRFGA